MTHKKFFPIMITLPLLFSACAPHTGINSIEDIYTDVTVVKPNSKNYKQGVKSSSTPIIKEQKVTQEHNIEKQSIHVKKIGRITNTIFDDEVKLYVYTFVSQSDGEYTVFYYDKKLDFASNTLLKIDILDNYLITATKQSSEATDPSSLRKKITQHKKRKSHIREAIEEKINTF